MRIAILDPAAGISGDMTLGALVASGLETSWVQGLPARLGVGPVGVAVERVMRSGIAATKVTFDIGESDPDAHHGRSIGALIDVVRGAEVSDRVRETAIRAFRLLGEAEGAVHGVEPDRVHLHEVGAIDAVLDIVGAIDGFERLGVEHVYHLPVAVGNGWVRAAHGELPVPAPATARLLEGIEVRTAGPVTGEATTPTGAVLLRVLSQGAPPQGWKPLQSGWGAGERDPAAYPNALRLFIGEATAEAGWVEVLATDIDDLQPEYVEPLRAAVMEAGALDCQVWSTQGKKGRIGIRVEALAPTEAAERVAEALFAHSTTGGIRRWPTWRLTLPRHEIAVELDETLRVRVKVWDTGSGYRMKPEYDDVVSASARLGRPALEVAREVERRAESVLRNGERSLEERAKERTE